MTLVERPTSLPHARPDARPVRAAARTRAYLWSTLREPPRSKFVLYAQGRSGSTLFGELLASHPEVVFADEILRGYVRHPSRYVEGLRRAPAARRHTFGFHVKVYQLSDVQHLAHPGEWLAARAEAGWRILHLRRANVLRQALSNMTRVHLDAPHFRDGDGRRRPAVQVDVDLLLRLVDNRVQVSEWEEATLAGVPHMKFEYESDLADESVWNATAARAYAYLDVDPRPVTTSLRKINAGDISALVSNYNDVVTAFSPTPHAWMLES